MQTKRPPQSHGSLEDMLRGRRHDLDDLGADARHRGQPFAGSRT
jgi:hypothetical protein